MDTDENATDSRQNPYEVSPVQDESLESSRILGRASIAFLFWFVMTIPAAVVAFCCTCTAVTGVGSYLVAPDSMLFGLVWFSGLVLGVLAANHVGVRMRQAADRAKQRSRSR